MIGRPGAVDARIGTIRFLKFAGVGGVGFLVDAAVLQAQLSFLGVSPYAAKLVSYLAAATVTWWLHRNTSFREAPTSWPVQQWARFVAANAIGGGVNYLMFAAFIATLPLAGDHPVIAVAAGSISGLVFNFALSKRYVFRIGAHRLGPETAPE